MGNTSSQKQKEEREILIELCKIKGIGIWTASIFAMGTLGYEDIFPYGDVSINKAIKNDPNHYKSFKFIKNCALAECGSFVLAMAIVPLLLLNPLFASF